jgi:hypothetical protein
VIPRTILLAKVAASAALLGIAVLSLNFASSLALSFVLGGQLGGFAGIVRFFAAYWLTMFAAGAFLYGAVLTIQGFTALLLPRRIFLRLSAVLQLVAFGGFLGAYFFLSSLSTYAEAIDPAHRSLMVYSPALWFFALFNQLNGSLPPQLFWLAHRAWIALGVVALGAGASLLLCYLRTMKKTVEEPDLVPAWRGSRLTVRLGSSLSTAILLFTLRSLTRSRHHRVVFAFYLALAAAVAFSDAGDLLSHAAPRTLNTGFLMTNVLMMSVVVLGLRSTFSLPISLTANWILRIAQLAPPQAYIAVIRRALLLFAVLPVFLVSACLSLAFRPLSQVAAHLAILALLGAVLAEVALVGLRKIPFTCSYLPGKVNVQFAFWGALVLLAVLALSFAEAEIQALHGLTQFAWMIGSLVAVIAVLWTFNRLRAKDVVLRFEELPPEVITTLGLLYVPPPASAGDISSS